MKSPHPTASYVISDDSSESSEDESDSDSESSNTDSSPTPKHPLFLENLIKIAQKHVKTQADTATFTKFIASFPIQVGQSIKRRSEETFADSAKKAKRTIKLYVCVECDKTFKDKDNLKKHQESCKKEEPKKSTNTAKKAFPCDKCDKSYVNKANLKRHVQSKHEVSAGVVDEQTQSKKYKCTLCKDLLVDIYKHYRSKHNIDNLQQVLFDDGTVLVLSDINTDKGNAPWFKKQLEKAKDRYKDTTCRLCDVNVKFNNTTLLKHHYTVDHRVDANSMSILQRIFRAEMGAHLGETDAKSKLADKKKVIIKGKDQNEQNTRIIYKCKCGIATESYDASVEHAQKHLVAYHTKKEMADTRNFAYEAYNNTYNNVFKVIKYDFETLLTEAWLEMFNDVAADKERILSSSIYMHSRSVKLHSEVTETSTGVPEYRCDMCQLFVDPTKIENHCINYKTCANNKPKGHYCEKCDAHFYSTKALEYHMENHAAGLRLVTFNNKNDVQMNNILRMLQNCNDLQEEEEEEIEVNPKKNADGKRIEIISEVVVTQFCKQCRDYVDASKFEAHNADHQKENEKISSITSKKNVCSTESVVVNHESATREDTEHEQQPQANHVDRMLTEDEEIPTNNVNSKENDGEVEPWDSDSDTCQGHTVSVVHADINMSVTNNMTEDVENARSPEIVLREMLGANDSQQSSMTVDKELTSTQELQQILGTDDTNNENCGEQNNATDNEELPTTQELKQLLSNDDTENLEGQENATEKSKAKIFGNDKVKARMSLRDIINKIISDDDVELEKDEFLKLNALISMNLSV